MSTLRSDRREVRRALAKDAANLLRRQSVELRRLKRIEAAAREVLDDVTQDHTSPQAVYHVSEERLAALLATLEAK